MAVPAAAALPVAVAGLRATGVAEAHQAAAMPAALWGEEMHLLAADTLVAGHTVAGTPVEDHTVAVAESLAVGAEVEHRSEGMPVVVVASQAGAVALPVDATNPPPYNIS